MTFGPLEYPTGWVHDQQATELAWLYGRMSAFWNVWTMVEFSDGSGSYRPPIDSDVLWNCAVLLHMREVTEDVLESTVRIGGETALRALVKELPLTSKELKPLHIAWMRVPHKEARLAAPNTAFRYAYEQGKKSARLYPSLVLIEGY